MVQIKKGQMTVLHLGMPKTGSTFLQWDVFRYMNDINFIFRPPGFKDLVLEIRDINREIDYESMQAKILGYFSTEKPNLISEENLYSNMFIKKDDRFIILDRIKKLFPEAKILFGIRDKKKLLLSWYKEYVANGGLLEFDEFIEKSMNLEKLNYETYIERLNELYGEFNVMVFRHEDLIKKKDETLKSICSFIGGEVPDYKKTRRNVSYGETELKASLVINRFFRSKHNTRGVPYPYNDFLLPHRILFQSRLFSWIPRKKVSLEDLIKEEKTKKALRDAYGWDI